jgi:hypothetical protein
MRFSADFLGCSEFTGRVAHHREVVVGALMSTTGIPRVVLEEEERDTAQL